MNTPSAWLLLLPCFAINAAYADAPVQELDEVEVTAPVQENVADSIAPATTILADEELRLKVGHSIGDTLKNESGITSQSFGPGVGTPVIRGQSGARVKMLANGSVAMTFQRSARIMPLALSRCWRNA